MSDYGFDRDRRLQQRSDGQLSPPIHSAAKNAHSRLGPRQSGDFYFGTTGEIYFGNEQLKHDQLKDALSMIKGSALRARK